MSYNVYKTCAGKQSKLRKATLNLHSVSGAKLKVKGLCNAELSLAGGKYSHPFYVVEDLETPVILGRLFLIKYKVVIDLANNNCSIGNKQVAITRNADIPNLVRLSSNLTLGPQQAVVCLGKCQYVHLAGDEQVVVDPMSNGDINHEPGLQVVSCLAFVKQKKVPVLIRNTTMKHYHLKKGTVVAQIEIGSGEVLSVSSQKPQLYKDVIRN